MLSSAEEVQIPEEFPGFIKHPFLDWTNAEEHRASTERLMITPNWHSLAYTFSCGYQAIRDERLPSGRYAHCRNHAGKSIRGSLAL